MRFLCVPAAIQADISSIGDPSEVTSPLKTLTATCFSSALALEIQTPREITPDAPSPRSSLTWRSFQLIELNIGSLLTASLGRQGLPAKAKKDNSGSSLKSHVGISSILLADNRRRPSFLQLAISSGKLFSWFPASMHFWRRWHFPILRGSKSIRLFVRINHLRFGGSESSGIFFMPLPLNAIISRERHSASCLGKVAKLQSEKKAILRLCRRPKSDGSSERSEFPER